MDEKLTPEQKMEVATHKLQMAANAMGDARDWVGYFYQPLCVQLREGVYQMEYYGKQRGGLPILEPLKRAAEDDAVSSSIGVPGYELVIPMCQMTLAQNPRKLRLSIKRDERSAVIFVDVDPKDIYCVMGVTHPGSSLIEEART